MPQLDFAFRRAWALALMAGLVASAFGVLLGVQVRAELHDRAAIAAEYAALEPVRALLDALRLTQRHRTLSAALLGGDDAAEAPRGALQAELDDAVARVALQLDQAGASEPTRADWAEVRQRWAALASAVGRRALGAADSLARHGELIEAQLDVHDRLTERPVLAIEALWSRYRGLHEAANRAAAQTGPSGVDDPATAAAIQALQQALLAGLDAQGRRLEQRRQEVDRRTVAQALSALALLMLGTGLIATALRAARRPPTRPRAEPAVGSAATPAAVGRRLVAGLARPAGNSARSPRVAPAKSERVQPDDELSNH